MKKIVTVLLLSGFIACQSNDSNKDQLQVKTNPLLDINLDTVPKTTVTLLDTAFNFGTIKEGDTIMRAFRFINAGTKPLIIQMAQASCGCTVVDRPDKPIMPGDTSFIKATFDSKGKGGETVMKQVFVHSNADPEFTPFIIRGKIEKSNK
jgi:hypothetical protein